MKKVFLQKGVKDCAIVIPENASLVEKTAAAELFEYIKKALDTELDIVTESKASGKCIFVGQSEYAKNAGLSGKSNENWIIKMVDGNLVLTGGKAKRDRGIIYSAYHFLEDFVGVRWWSPFEEDVLSLSELCLEEDLYVEGTPAIYFRNPHAYSAGIIEIPYMARTRINTISPRDDRIENGVYDPEALKYGNFMHAGRPHHAHTATKYFPVEETFEEHPDWYAWNKIEKRHIKDGGLCLCNKELQKAFLDKLMAYIEEDIKLSEETGAEIPCFYSLSQDDVYEDSFCQCEECTKIVEKSGFSGYLIQFINKIAGEVAKKYPFIKIEYLAYLNFLEPPKDDTVPASNVITRMAHLREDVFHGINEKTNSLHLRYLKEWSAIAKKSGSDLYVWEYMYNQRFNYPAPLYVRLKDTIKTYHKYGVSGAYVETQTAGETMWTLNNYMMTHLLENPDIDADALEADFITRYYGEAGEFVKEYMALIREKSQKYMLRTYCTRESSRFNYVDYDMAIRGTELLEKAKAAVAGKEPYAERVGWLQKPMDTVIFFNYYDLKRMAESNGAEFFFDREELRARICTALTERSKLQQSKGQLAGFIEEREFFETTDIGELKNFEIPEELKDVNPDDIYQFSMTDMLNAAREGWRKSYGASLVDDGKASCGRALKFNPDKAIPILGMRTMRPTSKHAEHKKSVDIFIKHNDDPTDILRMYSEDFPYGDYKLLKVGTASGLMEQNDVRVAVMWDWDVNVNLSGIAVNFPMNECDVYISMRSTGDVYGGKPGEENAFYLDRLVLVRKK